MKKDTEYIQEATRVAKDSESRFRVGAIVVGKKSITKAVNIMWKTHPVQAHYARQAYLQQKMYLHAEIAALLRNNDDTAHTLYVSRVLHNGQTAIAKPCPVCQLAIQETTVERVVYTSGPGGEIEEYYTK